MYCHYFGFAEKPFKPTPEPRFLFPTPQHKEALAAILYTIRSRTGFVAVLGEPGTGKTTLLRTALRQLDKKTKAAFIFNTELIFEEILLLVLDDFGLLKAGDRIAKIDLVRRLNHYAIRQMAAGGNVVIMLDEAQNLSAKAIEGLRLISNLESEEKKLIQIVMSGQTELNKKLAATEQRKFNQRIPLKRSLTQLTQEQVKQYLQHRLTVARYSGPPIFPQRTLKLVHEYSGGVPRLINSICENALVAAYSQDRKTVESSAIEEIAKELGLVKIAGNGHKRGRLFGRLKGGKGN